MKYSPHILHQPDFILIINNITTWPWSNQHSVTIIIKNLTDQVKLNTGTQYNVRKQIPPM